MNSSTHKKTVLVIKSSPKGETSTSNEVADFFTQQLLNQQETCEIIIRDLSKTPAPLLDGPTQEAFYIADEELTKTQRALVAPSIAMIEELKGADIVVLASPMHNFSVSSLLKAYIDQVCRFGLTFQYGLNGPEGLLQGKKAIIVSSAGMDFQAEAAKKMDFQTPYLKHILSFMGFKDINVVPVQGVDRSDANPKNIIASAKSTMEALV
ncbi:FMN-dependent NADH-azoreductase [Psychromonas aquimarina]|uniref:FMN-dependent NADH-azoreductase n=1 Tax=Psychromonas aquimarina TaxID=444919 RepID=UPI00040A5B98|nr:NAD(P)H-dependent oxidoreductase [Psychromonas aquimarina]